METSLTYNSMTDKENILNILPIGYEYNLLGEYKFKDEQDFQCFINIKKVYNEEDAKKWISKLSECTLTTWRVQRTYPASSRCNVYKIAMKCQHNVNHKFKSDHERKRNHISKHTGCPSNLILTIKRYVKKSKAKRFHSSNPSLIDWPCFISLKFIHNHPLNTAAVLRFRPLCNEIKDKLVKLFKKGHNPTSALESIKLDLFLDYNEKYFDLAEDRSFVPTLSQVQYLFNQTLNSSDTNDLNCFKPSIESVIEEFILSNSIGRAEIGRLGDSKFLAICSPLMARAHKLLPHSSEMVLLESSNKIDKKGHYVYFLESTTLAGSIPLGCIITEDNGPNILNAAILTLKRCFLPDYSFYGQSYPNILLSNDDINVQESLKIHWPNSKFLLCQSHVLKNAWIWVHSNNNVPKAMKEDVYYSVKRLVYCSNESDLFQLNKLLINKYHTILPKFLTYLNRLWPDRHKWSSAYRSIVPTGGNCTFNYVELTFKVMKDCLLERCKHFTLVQLFDLILVHYEKFIQKRLIEFVEGKVSKRLLYNYIPPISIINPSTITQNELDRNCYLIPSESDYNIKHMVDVNLCLCSCEYGKSGRICKHLCGVINQIENPNCIPEVSQDFKQMLYKIALGKDFITNNEEYSLESIPSPQYEGNAVNNLKIVPEKTMCLSQKEDEQLNNVFISISDGLKNKSDLFVPAVKSFLQHYSEMKSEAQFIEALQMFGKHRAPLLLSKRGLKGTQKRTLKEKNYEIKRKTKTKKLYSGFQGSFVQILPKSEHKKSISDPLDQKK